MPGYGSRLMETRAQLVGICSNDSRKKSPRSKATVPNGCRRTRVVYEGKLKFRFGEQQRSPKVSIGCGVYGFCCSLSLHVTICNSLFRCLRQWPWQDNPFRPMQDAPPGPAGSVPASGGQGRLGLVWTLA